MVKLYEGGVYLVNGKEIVPEAEAAKVGQMTGKKVSATRTIQRGALAKSGKYKPKKKLDKGWKSCGAVKTVRRKGGSYNVRKDSSGNENVYWGIQKTFGKLNISGYPRLCLTVKDGKLTKGKTELLVRVFSGNRNVFEASGDIINRKTQRLVIDLSKWKYRSCVTKIQILLKRQSGNWKSGAGVVLEKIGFR